MKIPKPVPGYERQWVKCKTCGRVLYYDYIPRSLSQPIMTLPCRHGLGERFADIVEHITADEALRELVE